MNRELKAFYVCITLISVHWPSRAGSWGRVVGAGDPPGTRGVKRRRGSVEISLMYPGEAPGIAAAASESRTGSLIKRTPLTPRISQATDVLINFNVCPKSFLSPTQESESCLSIPSAQKITGNVHKSQQFCCHVWKPDLRGFCLWIRTWYHCLHIHLLVHIFLHINQFSKYCTISSVFDDWTLYTSWRHQWHKGDIKQSNIDLYLITARVSRLGAGWSRLMSPLSADLVDVTKRPADAYWQLSTANVHIVSHAQSEETVVATRQVRGSQYRVKLRKMWEATEVCRARTSKKGSKKSQRQKTLELSQSSYLRPRSRNHGESYCD